MILMSKIIYKIKCIFRNISTRRRFLRTHKYVDRSIQLKNAEQMICALDCSIGANSRLLCWKQYVYKGIKQNVNGVIEIGMNFHATRNLTIQSCGELSIGDNVLIASDVFICNYDHGMGNLTESYLNNELVPEPVVIGDGVWLGDKVIVLKGVTIGEHSIVGAGSVVTKSIPPYCIAVGNPACVVKRYNPTTNMWEKVNAQ
ncbi:acyltransferase [Bifidobacterium animalis]|uniref:acyltransferase n=1 Tax=Bifidobacterium animalis TaxID=28025 RepID=UPI0009B9BD79|nr:acyltransferase [Bifidobacterium animalis]